MDSLVNNLRSFYPRCEVSFEDGQTKNLRGEYIKLNESCNQVTDK